MYYTPRSLLRYSSNEFVEVEQFERDGFAVLHNFLSKTECDQLRQAGLEFTKHLPGASTRTIFSSSGNSYRKNKYFLESNDKIRPFFEASAVDHLGNLKVHPSISLNKVGHALHLLHPLFRCYTYSTRVKNVCLELQLKSPAVVQSMLVYKNPGRSQVAPHQDITYLYTEPVPPIGFWIALEDATVLNGCLWISLGSHNSGVHRRLLRNPDKESDELLIYDKPAPMCSLSNFASIQVKKGDCILLHGRLVHKSMKNMTNVSWAAYTFHVVEQYKNTYSSDNWLQEGPNAPFQNLYNTKQFAYTPAYATAPTPASMPPK